MKKLVAIFFLTVLSIHFITCTAYTNGFFFSKTEKTGNIHGIASNEFMQFEANDQLEETFGLTELNFTPTSKNTVSVHHSIQHYILFENASSQHSSARPLFISNHTLLI